MSDPGPADNPVAPLTALEASLRERPSDPELWLEYAHALGGVGRWEDALKATVRAVEVAPALATDVRILQLEATALIELSRPVEALERLDRMASLGLDTGRWAPLLRGTALNALGRHADAISSITEAERRWETPIPRDHLVMQRIVALNGLGRHADALQLAEEAEPAWSGQVSVGGLLLQKAIALTESEHADSALEVLERARKAWPEGVPTDPLLLQTAHALNANGAAEAALAVLDEMDSLPASMLPADAGAFPRGLAQVRLGRLEEAVESFRKVKVGPPAMLGLARAFTGRALFQLGRHAEAGEPLTQAVALANSLPGPVAAGAAYLLGALHLRARQPERAVDHLQTALRLEPGMVAASNDLVMVLHRLARRDEARRVNDDALARAVDDGARAQAWLGRMMIEARERRPQPALDALAKATQYEPRVRSGTDVVTTEASLLISLGRSDEALRVLDGAAADNPVRRGGIELMRAGVLLLRGDAEASLAAYARVVELPDPSPPDVSLLLAKATAHLSLGSLATAVRVLDHARTTSEEVEHNGVYWLTRAMALSMIGPHTEALEAADRGQEIFGPQNYAIRVARALALAGLDRYQDALVELDWALEQLAGTGDAAAAAPVKIQKGFVLGRLHQPARALEVLREAKVAARDVVNRVSATVGEALALFVLGEQEARHREEGLRILREAAPGSDALPARMPHRGLAWWALGTLYTAEERYDEARDAFSRAAVVEPRSPRILIDLGYTHSKLEEFSVALRCFRDAETHAGNDGERVRALRGQGGALALLAQYDDAVAAYRSAIALQDENATSWQALGEAYAADRRHRAAYQAFLRAYQLSPADKGRRRPSASALGVSAQLLALDKNEDASRFLERARHEAEPDPRLEFNRGLALARLRRYRAAVDAFRAAKDVVGAADQIEALEVRRARGRSWLDFWFGPETSRSYRAVGGVLLGLVAALMSVMLLNPEQIAVLAWLNTTDAWKILGALVVILLLPSVGRLKWGEVEIQSSPVETSPEIHLSPSEPRTAMELLLQSSSRTSSLLGPAGVAAPATLSPSTVPFGPAPPKP